MSQLNYYYFWIRFPAINFIKNFVMANWTNDWQFMIFLLSYSNIFTQKIGNIKATIKIQMITFHWCFGSCILLWQFCIHPFFFITNFLTTSWSSRIPFCKIDILHVTIVTFAKHTIFILPHCIRAYPNWCWIINNRSVNEYQIITYKKSIWCFFWFKINK